MAFDKAEREELRAMFSDLRSGLHSDIISDIKSLLQPIWDEIHWIKERLERTTKTESEDVQALFHDLEALKRKVKRLEVRLNSAD